MIKYHERYAAINGFPGYFWNLEEEALYSIKIQGVLKRIKRYIGNYYSMSAGIPINEPYYQFYKNGRKWSRTVKWIKDNLVYEDTIC